MPRRPAQSRPRRQINGNGDGGRLRLQARDTAQVPARVKVGAPPVAPRISDRLLVPDVREGDALPDEADGESEAEVRVVYCDGQGREQGREHGGGRGDERKRAGTGRLDGRQRDSGDHDHGPDDGPAGVCDDSPGYSIAARTASSRCAPGADRCAPCPSAVGGREIPGRRSAARTALG